MDKFQMALVVAALFLVFILKGVYDKIAYKKKLRQKLEAVGPQVIQTVWGVGYKFDDEGNE